MDDTARTGWRFVSTSATFEHYTGLAGINCPPQPKDRHPAVWRWRGFLRKSASVLVAGLSQPFGKKSGGFSTLYTGKEQEIRLYASFFQVRFSVMIFAQRTPKQLALILIGGVAVILGIWGGLISVGLLDPLSRGNSQASPEQRQAVLGRWCSTDQNTFTAGATLEFAGQGLDLRMTSDISVLADFRDAPVRLFTENRSVVFTVDRQPGMVFLADVTGDSLILELYRKLPATDFGMGEFLHRQFYERCQ